MKFNVSCISEWFDRGIKEKQEFMIIVCDTYDYEDYPVYATSKNFKEEYEEHNGRNMQKIMEVYDLGMDKEIQMNEFRAKHYLKDFKERK